MGKANPEDPSFESDINNALKPRVEKGCFPTSPHHCTVHDILRPFVVSSSPKPHQQEGFYRTLIRPPQRLVSCPDPHLQSRHRVEDG